MTRRSDTPDSEGHLTFRGFQDDVDFEIIAQIRNKSTQNAVSGSVTPVNANQIETLVSSTDRLRIAQFDQAPIGFILVSGKAGPQLDEYSTTEGKSWLFVGPMCVPEFKGKGIESELLDWLLAYAREAGISRLIKFTKENTEVHLNELLARAKFQEKVRYCHMLLEMTAPPPSPKKLPDDLELINFRGEDDFDTLWSVLEPAFDYLERDSTSYERNKATFGSIKSTYFPICLVAESGNPVGTIAMVLQERRAQIATFGVIPAFQRRGIGSLLMERAIDHAWHIGIRTVDLWVRVENPQAIRIYKQFGFQRVPERTTIVMVRDN